MLLGGHLPTTSLLGSQELQATLPFLLTQTKVG